MKSKNMMVFANELRTTTLAQGGGSLHRVSRFGNRVEEEFCCIGVGCRVARIRVDPRRDEVWNSPTFAVAVHYEGCSELPPIQFFEWLGFENARMNDNHDLHLDVPTDWKDLDGQWMLASCALTTLNDRNRLTFAQIGDLIAYFGLLDGYTANQISEHRALAEAEAEAEAEREPVLV